MRVLTERIRLEAGYLVLNFGWLGRPGTPNRLVLGSHLLADVLADGIDGSKDVDPFVGPIGVEGVYLVLGELVESSMLSHLRNLPHKLVHELLEGVAVLDGATRGCLRGSVFEHEAVADALRS